MTIDYSIVIPVYNEEKNIEDLHSKILKAMSSINSTFEVIYVDDGSYDKGMDVLLSISKNNRKMIINYYCYYLDPKI